MESEWARDVSETALDLPTIPDLQVFLYALPGHYSCMKTNEVSVTFDFADGQDRPSSESPSPVKRHPLSASATDCVQQVGAAGKQWPAPDKQRGSFKNLQAPESGTDLPLASYTLLDKASQHEFSHEPADEHSSWQRQQRMKEEAVPPSGSQHQVGILFFCVFCEILPEVQVGQWCAK